MKHHISGLTLIELLVVVALMGVLVSVAVPSFRDLMLMQRLRGHHAQLVTDMQYARSEAVARRNVVRFRFMQDSGRSCYTIYVSSANNASCDCLSSAAPACTSPATALKTITLPSDLGVRMNPISTTLVPRFGFDWRTGGLVSSPEDNDPTPMDRFIVETYIDAQRKLQARLNQAGRPLACRPAGSTMSETACLP
jgi:prepilin-type N-terminal cleavage/methylation domain-containing protein